MPNSSSVQRPRTPEEAIHAIDEFVSRVRQPLAALASHFAELRGPDFDTVPVKTAVLDELACALEPDCLDVLTRPEPRLIEGIGLVWVGAGEASGMLWWRADNQVIARKQHVFNPESDSFYDYRNSIWYQGALGARSLAVVGPYIDAWGTDDHTLTASMKICGSTGVTGVAAIDLNLQTFISAVEDMLSELPNAALVSSEDRVIASNVALLTPGLRLESFLRKSGANVAERLDTALETCSLIILRDLTRSG